MKAVQITLLALAALGMAGLALVFLSGCASQKQLPPSSLTATYGGFSFTYVLPDTKGLKK